MTCPVCPWPIYYAFVYLSSILVYLNQLSKLLSPQSDCVLLKSRAMPHILDSLASSPELGTWQILYSVVSTIAARVEIQPLEDGPRLTSLLAPGAL